MKIVLRESVDHLGERGQVVTVAAGYARNFLLPKGLAYEATPGNLKVLGQQRRVWAMREARELDEAKQLAGQLEAFELRVARKSGESGTLYGSVTPSDVAELIAARGVKIDRRRLAMPEPIKTLGTHEVPLRLHRDVTAKIRLEVLAEESAG